MEVFEVLEVTPFGFVFRLNLEGHYYTPSKYELYLNGRLHCRAAEATVPVFGLESGTVYIVELKGLDEEIRFQVKTEKAEFVINVRDYNASGDGLTNDTSAINAAIYTTPRGGVVRIPRGTYLVNQVLLKSGVDLYLEKGAVLLQSTNRGELAILHGYQKNWDFTEVTVNASWEGHPLDCYGSLIYGKAVEDIRLYGEGVLDGNGQQGDWWNAPKEKNRAYRPRNVFLADCRRVTLMGITSRNSAAWNIHPFYCQDVRFYCLHIESDPASPNTDGLNPESCENVEINGCRFLVGDDCIAIKSGKYFMARRHYRPTKNVTICNCLMEKGHGGVVIGSEIACGAENILITHCYFKGIDRGLRIKTRRGRGNRSVIRNIRVSHIKMEAVLHCFVINMYYCCDPDGHSDYVRTKEALPVDEGTPSVEQVVFTDITAENTGGSAIFIYGLPESKVTEIAIRDSKFQFCRKPHAEPPVMMDDCPKIDSLGVFVRNAKRFSMKGTLLEGEHVNIIEETHTAIV